MKAWLKAENVFAGDCSLKTKRIAG